MICILDDIIIAIRSSVEAHPAAAEVHKGGPAAPMDSSQFPALIWKP